MKFFKYTALALMGLAVSLTSCSDDDDYTVGAQSPGAFFQSALPSTVNLSDEAGTFTVELNRTGADAPSSYTVTLTDADNTGLFTTQTEAVFSEGEISTELVVSYDPAKVEYDKEYKLTLSVSPASDYGNASYSFVAVMKTPLVTETLKDAVWTFGSPFGPAINERNVVQSYSPKTPNNVTFTVIDFIGSYAEQEEAGEEYEPYPNIVIEIPDMNNVVNGRIPCRILPQYIGVDNTTGQIWFGDIASVYDYAFGPGQGDNFRYDSYYEPERGLFTFHCCYFLPSTIDHAAGSFSWFGDTMEYLQLPGFPELNCEVEYNGTMINPDGSYVVKATVTPAKDVATFKAVCVPGRDVMGGLEAIQNGAAGVQEQKGNSPVTFEFPVTDAGYYTVVAQTYDAKGQAAESAYAYLKLVLGAPDFKNVGVAEYYDPFIAPRFNVKNEQFKVNLLSDNKTQGVYYLQAPYLQAGFALAEDNENTFNDYVAFDVSDPGFVLIPQQFSGFESAQYYGGDVEIGNLESFYATRYPNVSHEQIKQVLSSDEEDPITEFSSFEDGIVTICNPMFSNNGNYGYQLKSNPQGFIIFPETSSAAKRKALSHSVVRPSFKGMVKIASCKNVKNRFSAKTIRKIAINNTFVNKKK